MDPARNSRLNNIKASLSQNQDLFDNILVISLYSVASFACLILFHLSAARYLGPELYSVLGVFASILFTVSLVSMTIYFVITRFVTYHHTRYQYEEINYLVSSSLKYFFASGFVVFLLIFLFAGPIAAFFNIDTIGPVVMLGFAIWLQLLVPIYEGAFKGLENLHAMGRMRVIEALSRLIILLLLAYLHLSVTAMVFTLGAGTFVALAASYVPIKELQKLHQVRPNMQEIWEYAWPAALTTAALAILLNVDVIAVKHFFPPSQAGYYTAASWLAKVPFIASLIFSSVIFPRVTKLFVDGKPSNHLLRSTLKWMVSLMILNTLFCILFANKLLGFVFNAYIPATYIGPYAFAMGLLAIVNTLAIYQLAQRRFTLSRIVPWFLLAEIVLLYFFHATPLIVVLVAVLVTMLLAATCLYVLRNDLQLEYMFNE